MFKSGFQNRSRFHRGGRGGGPPFRGGGGGGGRPPIDRISPLRTEILIPRFPNRSASPVKEKYLKHTKTEPSITWAENKISCTKQDRLSEERRILCREIKKEEKLERKKAKEEKKKKSDSCDKSKSENPKPNENETKEKSKEKEIEKDKLKNKVKSKDKTKTSTKTNDKESNKKNKKKIKETKRESVKKIIKEEKCESDFEKNEIKIKKKDSEDDLDKTPIITNPKERSPTPTLSFTPPRVQLKTTITTPSPKSSPPNDPTPILDMFCRSSSPCKNEIITPSTSKVILYNSSLYDDDESTIDEPIKTPERKEVCDSGISSTPPLLQDYLLEENKSIKEPSPEPKESSISKNVKDVEDEKDDDLIKEKQIETKLEEDQIPSENEDNNQILINPADIKSKWESDDDDDVLSDSSYSKLALEIEKHHIDTKLFTEKKSNDLNNEYEEFLKSLCNDGIDLHSETDNKLVETNILSGIRSRSSSTSSTSSSSSISSTSSNSSTSTNSTASTESSIPSPPDENFDQKKNDLLRRTLEKIMEIIPKNKEDEIKTENLKAEILKLLGSESEKQNEDSKEKISIKLDKTNKINDKPNILATTEEEEPPKLFKLKTELPIDPTLKIWNISQDSDELHNTIPSIFKITKSPPKTVQSDKSSEKSKSSHSKSPVRARGPRTPSPTVRRRRRSTSRTRRSRDRRSDRHRRSSSREKSRRSKRTSPRSPTHRRKSRTPPPPRKKYISPPPRIRPRRRSLSPIESISSNHRWPDHYSDDNNTSYTSRIEHPPPSIPYSECISSSWSDERFSIPQIHSDVSMQYGDSPQRMSLDDRINLSLGIIPPEGTQYPVDISSYPPQYYHHEPYVNYNPYYAQYQNPHPPFESTNTHYPSNNNFPTPTELPSNPPIYHQSENQFDYYNNQFENNVPIAQQQLEQNTSVTVPPQQSAKSSSFAVQVGNVLEIIPSEIPNSTNDNEILSNENKSEQQSTTNQSIIEMKEIKKNSKEQKRLLRKMRKERLRLEFEKLSELYKDMGLSSDGENLDNETIIESTSKTECTSTNTVPKIFDPDKGILKTSQTYVTPEISSGKKKVMFLDGIEPGNGTSTTDEENQPTIKKSKKYRKKKLKLIQNKENVNVQSSEIISVQKTVMVEGESDENLPPPSPPPGSPPPNLPQPKLKNPPPPEYLYFHVDPIKNCFIMTRYCPNVLTTQHKNLLNIPQPVPPVQFGMIPPTIGSSRQSLININTSIPPPLNPQPIPTSNILQNPTVIPSHIPTNLLQSPSINNPLNLPTIRNSDPRQNPSNYQSPLPSPIPSRGTPLIPFNPQQPPPSHNLNIR